jgi:hypothetical protein
MAHDAFISHSSSDKAVADTACALLESHGVRCWIAPRDLLAGRPYGEALVEAIRASRLFILVFSGSANDSPQVTREVERAVNAGIPILPFRIENVPPSRALEYFLPSIHWLDAFTPPVEQHLLRLADSANRLLGREYQTVLTQGTAAATAAWLLSALSPPCFSPPRCSVIKWS